jgi:flagellar motor switch protein FliM
MNDGLNQRDVDSLFRRSSPGAKSNASDSLTQREIDAILQKSTPVPLAPVVSDDVTTYNFSRPPRVSKDRRASLESLYTRFALSLQALLASLLRTPLDVVVGSVEQAMFSEYILSLGTPCATFVFDLGDRMGTQGAIDLSTDFAFLLVDRLFGGPGDAHTLQRPLTLLEQAVVRNVTERSLGLLRDAWADHLAMSPKVSSFESNPEMLQITSREDNVLVTNLEIRSLTFNGFIALCLPMAALESFLQEKGSTSRPNQRHRDADAVAERAVMTGNLKHAHLDLVARFPTLWLSGRQLGELAPGKVLHTGVAAEESVEVLVNERLRFQGALGQVRRQLGLRITDQVTRPAAERPVQSRQGRVL